MQDLAGFITQATEKIGISESSARSAAGGMFDLLRDHGHPSDVEQLMRQIPGAAELTPNSPKPATGMLGAAQALMGRVTSETSQGTGVLGVLAQSGMGAGKAALFASMFATFLKQNASVALVDRVLDAVPNLRRLIG